MADNLKGINYSIGYGNEGLWKRLFLRKENVIKSDLLFIRDKLNCRNVRIFGSKINQIITAGQMALDLKISPWLSPRFIDSDFETTKELLKEFCFKAKGAGFETEPLFVANELVLDCSNSSGKKVNSWPKRISTVLNDLKTGKVFDVTDKVSDLVKIARGCGWKGPLSYASFMYETVDWESINDDNFIVAQNLYWGKDLETDEPEESRIYAQKIKKLIEEARGREVVISEYGAVPHKDGLAAGGGEFMLRGEVDYDAQKDALIRYFEIFKEYRLANFLFCFEDAAKNPEGSFGIINRKRMDALLPGAQKFARLK